MDTHVGRRGGHRFIGGKPFTREDVWGRILRYVATLELDGLWLLAH
jgi:hypothetical protein